MSQPDTTASLSSMNPVALSSYAVAFCSLAAAPMALVFKGFPGIGLATVGAFYLVVGVSSQLLASRGSFSKQSIEIGGHTSGADNLVAESLASHRDVDATVYGSDEIARQSVLSKSTSL